MLGDYQSIQPIVYNILSNEIKEGKVKHAYLFDVSSYTNDNFITSFIKSILCPLKKLKNDNCQNCNICKTIDDKNFPDLYIIDPDGVSIKKEQLLELQKKFKTKSLYNNKKVYIIRYAENLNATSANSILKFLEEPEPNIIAILLTKNINNVIPTIISRCEIISLLPDKDVSLMEKIGQVAFNSKDIINDYLNDDNIEDTFNAIVSFIDYYENYGLDILTHTNKYWFNIFGDKKANFFGYALMLLYYKDLLNYKLNRELEIFKDYELSIEKNSSKNELSDLYKKISLIIDAIDRNKLNINLSLNLDNLIIKMEG